MKNKKLQTDQLNQKLLRVKEMGGVDIPSIGWIKAIRTSIGMTLEQLGRKLNITKQSVQEMENREKNKSITLKSMEEVATALDMKLIYALIPKDESLDAMIERKANELATKIVVRTSHNMKLEDQGNTEVRIRNAIKERAYAIKNELPKILWD